MLPRATWAARSVPAGPLVTLALLIVNVGVFVAHVSGASDPLLAENPRFDDVGLSREAVADGEWWRVLTSGFTHLDVGHLLSNAVVLLVVGTFLEATISRIQLAALYLVGLVGGALGSMILEPGAVAAGASGAIFGLTGAGAVVLYARGGRRAREAALIFGLLLAQNLYFTFESAGISVGGHLGGLQLGLVGGLLLSKYDVAARVSHAASLVLLLDVALIGFAGCIAVARV